LRYYDDLDSSDDVQECRFVKFTKVKRERASDAVIHILRESILDQTFSPGERIDVKMLAHKLDVSLTPVKDAINRLAVEGLIELKPRSGTFVTSLSPKDVEETLAVRRALECLAAETAVVHVTDEDIADLRAIVEALGRSFGNERDRQQHERKNNEFHQRLLELSGNTKIVEIYANLNAHIKIARVHYTSASWRQRLQAEQAEHRKILDCLEQRNGRALQRALEEHIGRATAALVNDLKRKARVTTEE
jgi:DNA-binding GntR family transcriptional regulator